MPAQFPLDCQGGSGKLGRLSEIVARLSLLSPQASSPNGKNWLDKLKEKERA